MWSVTLYGCKSSEYWTKWKKKYSKVSRYGAGEVCYEQAGQKEEQMKIYLLHEIN